MSSTNGTKLKRAKTPEEISINSVAIQKMVAEFCSEKINIHSFMILRNGIVGAEGYAYPFTAKEAHAGYSLSKSLLSIAYGFALNENKIQKTTKFIDVFTEYKNTRDKRLKQLTIHQLMCMRSGKQTSIRQIKVDSWFKSFINAKWIFNPNENWRYVSENYYIAAQMLCKILGQTINEFLTPRLYKPLGIEIPRWERDKNGIEAGGWGIYLKTEDIAKIILCCHNEGFYQGKKVIPTWWIKEATSLISQTENAEKSPDCQAGYGCGFWRCKGAEGFRMEGLYGQYAISLKKYDACIITTAGHSDLQALIDCLWKHIPEIFGSENPTSFQDGIVFDLPAFAIPAKKPRSTLEKEINNKTLKFQKPMFVNLIGYPVSVLPMPVIFFCTEKGGNINNVRFSFTPNGCDFFWTEKGKYENSIPISLNGDLSRGHIYVGDLSVDVQSYGYWKNENTLVLHILTVGAVSERVLKFTFHKNKVTMHPSTIPDTAQNAKKIGEKLKCVLKGRYFAWWIDFLIPKINRILNPVHKGKI